LDVDVLIASIRKLRRIKNPVRAVPAGIGGNLTKSVRKRWRSKPPVKGQKMSNNNTSEKPVVVFISNDNDTVIGVMVIKNDDENLQNNLEIIEKNWVAARNELLQRAREDDSIEADEDELHIAFIAHELEMFDEPYETIDISGVYSVSNGNVDRI
jgi:hypothetical protein